MDSPILELASPNCRERDPGSIVDTLVLHYTGMQTGQAAIDRLRDPEAQVSSHYVVEEDGRIVRLVPERLRAAHAGISFWRGRSMLNDSSIGIEIVNPGHEWGYRPFPPVQIDAVRRLCLAILSRHAVPPINVVAHSDVAPDRKQDPGELFPWAALARAGIGLYPDDVPDSGTGDVLAGSSALAPVRAALRRIGYGPAPEGGMDEALGQVLTAFQRHWRPEAVNGLADAGTRTMSTLLPTAALLLVWRRDQMWPASPAVLLCWLVATISFALAVALTPADRRKFQASIVGLQRRLAGIKAPATL